jgi:MFS family permease
MRKATLKMKDEGAPLRAVAPATQDAPAASSNWLPARRAWYAVGMVAAVTMCGQVDRGIMALLLPSIKRDTQMSDTQLSLLLGLAFSLAYVLAGLPMARVSDVARRTVILPCALALWSVGTALCGVAQNFWQFFLARGMVGGGEAVKAPNSVSLISDLVPRDKLQRAFGVYNMAFITGESLSLVLGGLLLGALAQSRVFLGGIGLIHDWQLVFIILGLPGLGLAVLFLLTVPEPFRHGRKTQGSVSVTQVAAFMVHGPARRVLVPMFLATVTNGVYYAGVLSWRPSFYERTYDIAPRVYGPYAGLATLAVGLIGVMMGTLIVERMVKRWDDAHLRLAAFVPLATLPLALLGPMMPSFPLAFGFQLIVSLINMMGGPAQLAAMQIITPNEMRAQVNAVYMFIISGIGATVGPTVVALLTDYVFRDESQLRYAMVTAAAIALPLVSAFFWSATRPFGGLHRELISAERR